MSAATLIAHKERAALLQDQRGLGWLLVFSIVLSAFGVPLLITGLLGYNGVRRHWRRARGRGDA
jgi:hypothetical protein